MKPKQKRINDYIKWSKVNSFNGYQIKKNEKTTVDLNEVKRNFPRRPINHEKTNQKLLD